MIEVVPAGDGWTYRLIGATGAVLVYTAETWACRLTAFAAARDWRTTFWAAACARDHRTGACL